MIKRLTTKKVSEHKHSGSMVAIYGADLRELDVEPGDQIQVETHEDKIVIRKDEE